MKFAFIDYRHPVHGFANRDQTGGFGSGMHTNGLIGHVLAKLKKNKLRVPVLTLAYLNAIAKNASHSTMLCTGIPPEAVDIVIIASSMHHHKYEIKLAADIKSVFPDTKIGFIGPFSAERPEFFESVSDFIIIGEPETTFAAFCKHPYAIQGEIKALPVDVSNLPFPDWDEFDLSQYGYAPALPRKPFLTIQGSRGCPFACEFCPYLVNQGIPLRRRSNENIIDEIKHLVSRYEIKSLLFRDITWSMHRKLTKALCTDIAKENFDLDIAVETRADTLDDELILLMAKAKIRVVNLGLESPEDDILRASGRKPIKEDKVYKTISKLEAQGIKVQAFYMLGLVNDTEESMKKTIKYSQQINTFSSQYCILTPFPGTKTYHDLEHKIITNDYSKFTEYQPVVEIDGATPASVQQHLDMAYNQYYVRPAWVFKHGIAALKNLIC